MAWLGLDCMYRLLPLEFDGSGSNTSAEGDLELEIFEGDLEGLRL